MKRVTKIVGFIGALAALAWAMRDRLISVAISREPEPPAFSQPDAGPETIEGIGPVFAGRLREAGYDTTARLASASPDAVAEAAGVSVGRARTWIEKAAAPG